MKKGEFKVADLTKDRYSKSDAYLNGHAKHCGWKASLVYDSLCRHADRSCESFPSIELMAEEHGVSYNTIRRGVKTLEDWCIIKKEQEKSSKGKFLHNTYLLLHKDHWKKPVAPTRATDKVKANRSPVGKLPSPSPGLLRNTHIKEKNIIHSNGQAITGKEFNNLISLFEPINPSFERLFPNKSQRASLERLVKKHGIEKITKAIECLPKVINKPYAPRITTPYQLEHKLGDLIAFLNQEKKKGGGTVDARNL